MLRHQVSFLQENQEAAESPQEITLRKSQDTEMRKHAKTRDAGPTAVHKLAQQHAEQKQRSNEAFVMQDVTCSHGMHTGTRIGIGVRSQIPKEISIPG